eukprot:CAMPEP_0113897354 /NCGR_PEP_ID=MMETSP0780_2-20120614/18622_1 /TAXON_ID=652834 /ORGANISM="Palpitomonas bilix" /LENGTH=516 /DNA_ID=CAMNT_0000888787 /DNA_START=32 /DNA_END=1579 /DNA_ORIENTATION=- /assembly_acc=CAM_ASM_000599
MAGSKRKAEVQEEEIQPKRANLDKVPATGNVYEPPTVIPLSKKSHCGCVDRDRVRVLKNGSVEREGPVVYWMSRDQRSIDNWALYYAAELANHHHRQLHVVFNLVDTFRGAGKRQFAFMLKGMKSLPGAFSKMNIAFSLLKGTPQDKVVDYVEKNKAAIVVADYSPLLTGRKWKDEVGQGIDCPFHEVDAHNVVPVWKASDKQEWAAATIRPKIQRLLPKYFCPYPPFPSVEKEATVPILSDNMYYCDDIDFDALLASLDLDETVCEVVWMEPGQDAALSAMKVFLSPSRLKAYADKRNHPDANHLSHMSPYLHFGMISAQRLAMEAVKMRAKAKESVDAFIEEMVIRRELSDNFCHYNPLHDTYAAIPPWAKTTLDNHRKDKRAYLYTRAQLEGGKTHDQLWNAAQSEMVKTGKMHGYIRMYWAKKILEWTESGEDAAAIAIYLNDKYELDGRDPNGYVGCLWSIGGVHDRAWTERPIFGKVRYMNYDGCKRKFDIQRYISRVRSTPDGGRAKPK